MRVDGTRMVNAAITQSDNTVSDGVVRTLGERRGWAS
jgi:hypothetical protein